MKEQDEWDFYLTEMEGKPASFMVNLSLQELAPLEAKTYLLCVHLDLIFPTEDGLSSNSETDLLYKIEDSLEELVENRLDGIYIGRLTHREVRSFYFYMSEQVATEAQLILLMSNFPDYSYDYDISEDPQWDCYFEFLYPDSYELQTILNRRVLKTLTDNGDDLSIARTVDHWIYFSNEAAMEDFIREVEKESFVVEAKKFNEEPQEFPYLLHISREDSVEPESIDDLVLFLYEMAEKYDGNYDGWETFVVGE